MEDQTSPLNLVLRCGRYFGIAPISFNGNGITVSKRIYWYGVAVNILIGIITMTAYSLDLQYGQTKQALTTQSVLKIIIIFPLFILNIWTTFYGVYGAHKRMGAMMIYMKQAELIKLDLKFKSSKRSAKKRKIFFMIIILILCVLTCFDFTITLMNGLYYHIRIQYHYAALYIHYMLIQMLIMQFVFIVVPVNDLLGALALHLEEMLRHVCMQERSTLHSLKMGYETIRRLTQSYNDICGVMRQIEDAHGPLILQIFVILFIKLIFLPFKLILSIGVAWSPNLILQFCWCIYTVTLALTIIEPCHQSNMQTRRIQIVVSELICRLGHSNPVASALGKLYQQLLLNRVCYTLGNVATLDRPLLASMFGSITTYLVIVVQFQSN